MNTPARTPPLPLGQPANDARARAERFDARHAPANTTAEKPDEGKVLARVARPDGTEFRVSLHTFNGQPFIRLAPWQSNGWPVKGKGTTVKVRELGSVVKGLLDAMEDLDGGPTR